VCILKVVLLAIVAVVDMKTEMGVMMMMMMMMIKNKVIKGLCWLF
jgi:hypothetical protein